jgi:hypothetical protein
VNAALRELDDAGVGERPETVLADAGYWHKQQMENIVSDGIQVLVPLDGGLRKGIRPGWDKGMYAFMRWVLGTDYRGTAYKHRKATVEPVFAQIKFNRKINRFQRRGRAAALSEWRLVAATHNLLKLHSQWIAAEPAKKPNSAHPDTKPVTLAPRSHPAAPTLPDGHGEMRVGGAYLRRTS